MDMRALQSQASAAAASTGKKQLQLPVLQENTDPASTLPFIAIWEVTESLQAICIYPVTSTAKASSPSTSRLWALGWTSALKRRLDHMVPYIC